MHLFVEACVPLPDSAHGIVCAPVRFKVSGWLTVNDFVPCFIFPLVTLSYITALANAWPWEGQGSWISFQNSLNYITIEVILEPSMN